MNMKLIEMARSQEPKIKTLDPIEQSYYTAGLLFLAPYINETFFDIPPLSVIEPGMDGLFYNIPYLHDDVLHENGRTQTLLVVFRVYDGDCTCLLKMEFEVSDDEKGQFKITLCDQPYEENSTKHLLLERKNWHHCDKNEKLLDMNLSELVAHFSEISIQ